MSDKELRLLHRICRLYGIETGYQDFEGRRRQAAPESLLAVLRALGAPLSGLPDLPEALRARKREYWNSFCEPVAVSWDKKPAHLELRLPSAWHEHMAECMLELENGGLVHWGCRLSDLQLLKTIKVEGTDYELRRLSLPSGLPWGYHRLMLDLPSCRHEALIISAPHRAFTLASHACRTENRLWGCFLPLYALRSSRNLGSGDFTDLGDLLNWAGTLGGNFVGTLPLLAAFLDQPFSPSPYEPVSRLFWNEFYIDVEQSEEFKNCPKAQELLNSTAIQEELAGLRSAPLVDYQRIMAIKRKLLEYCEEFLFTADTGRREEMQRWIKKHPAVLDYARFRAAVEKSRTAWTQWPDRMRDGKLQEGDYDPAVKRYHLYVQWLARQQLQALSDKAGKNGQNLYLDFPLGVHRHGYDTWRRRSAFVLTASAGAPPDAFYAGGQNWGLPPLHPERIRRQGYRYFIACLRNHLRYAGILRLDHIMGLHRLFMVPEGLPAGEGVYVRYHAEEFYAILALESYRRQALLVGEDLGLAPAYVRRSMARHGIYRMHVLPFEYTGNAQLPLRDAPSNTLAALNTHDMPPFASFWLDKEKNPLERAALPVFLYRRGHMKTPTNNLQAVLKASLEYLAAGRAGLLLVNLEDLWLETKPQNIPGDAGSYPNWRRKARLSMEEFSQVPEVWQELQKINSLRRWDIDRS